MSVTSEYIFFQGFFDGIFEVINTVKAADQNFNQSSSGGGVVLTVQRPNAEILTDLGKQIATNETTGLVSNLLVSAGGSLTSVVRVQGVRWIDVPYVFQHPTAHGFLDMLVRVDFDFHIPTPWLCSDADGTISVYLFLFLDGQGHLQGHVDGAWFSYDGGGPSCTGTIDKGLTAALAGMPGTINPILKKALAPSAGVKFKRLYFLPGNGTKAAGVTLQNASADVALGLLI